MNIMRERHKQMLRVAKRIEASDKKMVIRKINKLIDVVEDSGLLENNAKHMFSAKTIRDFKELLKEYGISKSVGLMSLELSDLINFNKDLLLFIEKNSIAN